MKIPSALLVPLLYSCWFVLFSAETLGCPEIDILDVVDLEIIIEITISIKQRPTPFNRHPIVSLYRMISILILSSPLV
ncbi:hypothetical protein CIPAW_03G085600 [Carya illinoinensis]|uniref:Secreted protein n=1 Tax=Carya illinoinensis TaxID=32201 RepID=A0A8T1R225_CARIL|nr:hypothetical protein CIPAW_03G085600 [Carya illinoinensis]